MESQTPVWTNPFTTVDPCSARLDLACYAAVVPPIPCHSTFGAVRLGCLQDGGRPHPARAATTSMS